MKGYMSRQDALSATLRRLEKYGTLSPFSRLFYRVIYEVVTDEGLGSPKLEQAYHVFLRV